MPLHADNENLDNSINDSSTVNEFADSNGDLLETIQVLWAALVNHLEATIAGFKLDVKLAVSSLIALLVTGVVIICLLVGLWFLAMALLFLGLTALHIPAVAALLVLVIVQLLLLVLCRYLFLRFLTNLNFQATRAALPESKT